jgi:hypothetical protein
MTETEVEKEVKARYAIWHSLGLYSREELLSEIRKLNVEGKVIIPDGLKRVAEYFWGSRSLQIVEADNAVTVMKFAEQFSPYIRSFDVTALATAGELLGAR